MTRREAYYEEIKAIKAKGEKLKDHGFDRRQISVWNAASREAGYIMAGYENWLNDEGDYATKIPTAETLAQMVYDNIMSGKPENTDLLFTIRDFEHLHFAGKDYIMACCQIRAEKEVEDFNDWGRKYETF